MKGGITKIYTLGLILLVELGIAIYIELMGEKQEFYSFLIFPLLSTTYCSPDYAQKNYWSDKIDVTPMLWEGLGKQSERLSAQSDNWDSALTWVCKAHCSRQHTNVCRRENIECRGFPCTAYTEWGQLVNNIQAAFWRTPWWNFVSHSAPKFIWICTKEGIGISPTKWLRLCSSAPSIQGRDFRVVCWVSPVLTPIKKKRIQTRRYHVLGEPWGNRDHSHLQPSEASGILFLPRPESMADSS